MKSLSRWVFLPTLGLAAAPAALQAWGPVGHEIVNQVALASLPADFPAWIHAPANADRIVFLADEPDRWRDSTDNPMLNATSPDHEFNLEEIAAAGMDLATLPPDRYDFVVQFAAARAAHAANFEPIDPKYNAAHTQSLPGFLPWAVREDYAKLQTIFSYLKVYEPYGTPEEAENARANAIYVMGVMGHYVGDGSQPLHATIYYHGWTGPNPNGYIGSVAGWHAWIDSGFINKAHLTAAEVLPRVQPAEPLSVAARPDGRDPIFAAILDYVLATNQQVEPLYRLERDGPLRMNGPPTPEGRAFIDAQLLRGGEMLGALWITAWRHAGPDNYLQSFLVRRNAAARPAAAP